MQALHGFPLTISDGWKNTSLSLVLSLSETVGASVSDSSETDGSCSLASSALQAAIAGFSVILRYIKIKSDLRKEIILEGKTSPVNLESTSSSLSDSSTQDFFEAEAAKKL